MNLFRRRTKVTGGSGDSSGEQARRLRGAEIQLRELRRRVTLVERKMGIEDAPE